LLHANICAIYRRFWTKPCRARTLTLNDIDGIAVTQAPGLIGCLLVGLSFAKSLAMTLDVPLTPVQHLKGHLFSPLLEHPEAYPFLGFVVSGGHTALYLVKSFHEIEKLGQTVDDAAGEAYDKVAKILGLGYPGGPVIDKLAQKGNPNAYSFTRARVKKGPYFLSFSGLKTATFQIVDTHKKAGGELNEAFFADLAASFQKEAIDSLFAKVDLAVSEHDVKAVMISGGVAVNSYMRERAKAYPIPCYIPKPILCTDNGAMIAHVGHYQLQEGLVGDLSTNAFATKDVR
jgi:N6-L-threonylcarbamoyladenine synthase